jgi:hypothetical protein
MAPFFISVIYPESRVASYGASFIWKWLLDYGLIHGDSTAMSLSTKRFGKIDISFGWASH